MTTSPGPRRFLLAMWEGGGTVPPELALARRLLSRGHEVHVLGDPTLEDDARAAGCSFSPWRRAPHRTGLDPDQDLLRDWEVRSPLAMLARIRDVFVAGPAADYATDTAEVVDEVRPDAALVDFMLFGAVIGAQARGVPVAPVVPNVWPIPTPGGPAIGPGFAPARSVLGRTRDAVLLGLARRVFARGLPRLNAARAAHGLAPLTSFHQQILATDRIFVLTSPTFDFASATVPDNVRYLGPMTEDPDWAEPWVAPWSDDHPDPFVLVGLSSTFQDQVPLLRRIVTALSGLQVRGVATLGQMVAPGAVASTGNVHVVASAPHNPLLRRAALAVTHCGHGTTLKALAAGVPLVCIPMGRDQRDTAARVVHQGAGVRLAPGASVDAIRGAVTTVLGDSAYGREARRLAATIAEERRGVDIPHELESLVPASTAGESSSLPLTERR